MSLSLFFAFALIGLLAAAGIKFKRLTPQMAFLGILLIYACSVLPSFEIPHIIDDLYHFASLAQAMESGRVIPWMFEPHNEHVMPLIKFLYYVSFKNFGTSPILFHLAASLIWVGVLTLAYYLLLNLTGCRLSAFIAASLLAGTNLPDLALFTICDSHILFCLFFLLALFYSQYRYRVTGNSVWLTGAFLAAFLAPAFFALGLTSLFFAVIFEKLCLPAIDQNAPSQKRSALFLVTIAWLVSLLPYLLAAEKIIYAPHYQDLHIKSATESVNLAISLKYFLLYFYQDLIPHFFTNLYLAMGGFFLAAAAAWKYRNQLDWKKILFFAALGLLPTFIIYCFRAAWGPMALSYSRYDVFPSVMLVGIYAVIFSLLFKNKEESLLQKRTLAVYLLCFLIVAHGGAVRYHRAENIYKETFFLIQTFYDEYQRAFPSFFNEYPNLSSLRVKNSTVFFPAAASLTTRRGSNPPLARYPYQPLEFFSKFLLPAHIRSKIVWGDATDPAFVQYLETREYRHLPALVR